MTFQLRDRKRYEERYNRMTVEDCLRQESSLLEAHKDYENELEAKGHAIVNQCAWEIKKILLTKDWYDRKESTVNEWMQADEARDKMEQDGVSPKNILCKTCSDHMLEESRSTWEREGKEEVLFFMRCPGGHLPMQGIFQDGTEMIFKERLCPECKAVVNAERVPSDKTEVKTKYSCSNCDYEEIDAFSLSNDMEKDDTEFQENRSRFCLSGQGLKDVQEAILNMDRMKALVDSWNHEDENKEQYDAASKLQKLTIPQVKELIATKLEKTDYSNLTFEKPSIDKFVSMEFSLEELETDNQLASTSGVRKLIKKTLQNTNWRLMSDGISYRLGLMTGRLRAYESKQDLLKLVAKQ